MTPIIRPDWWLPESAATDQKIYSNRRTIQKGLGIGSIGAGLALSGAVPAHGDTSDLYPARKNQNFTDTLNGRPLTSKDIATTYNIVPYHHFTHAFSVSADLRKIDC